MTKINDAIQAIEDLQSRYVALKTGVSTLISVATRNEGFMSDVLLKELRELRDSAEIDNA